MVDDALNAADQLLSGVWKDKMRNILTGIARESTILQWNDDMVFVGDVASMGLNQFTIRPWSFQVGKGFQQTEPLSEITVKMISHVPFKRDFLQGETVVCMGKGWMQGETTVCLQKEAYVVPRPELAKDLSWSVTHFFCGAFGGWSQAVRWLEKEEGVIAIDREIFLDNSEEVMNTWSRNHNLAFVRAPLTKVKVWSLDRKAGILADVQDRTLMFAVDIRSNHLSTISPPCVTWSRGGKGSGLQNENGWVFIETILQNFRLQVNCMLMECADEFKSHPHACLVEKLLHLLGFRRVWEQISSFHLLSDCLRNRWLSVWVRSDLSASPVFATFSLSACPKTPWSSSDYDFVLPTNMQDQLELCQSEIAVYGDYALLPPAKKAKVQNPEDVLQVLGARAPENNAPLPTLCAMYSSQHNLNRAHLQNKGIYAVIVRNGQQFSFIDPVRWIAMLGATATLSMPSKITIAFHQIGNAISTPQAMLPILVMLQSVLNIQLSIKEIVQKLWNQRHTKQTSIVLAGTEYWTVIKLEELPKWGPDPTSFTSDSFHDALTSIRIEVRNPAKAVRFTVEAPEHWSILRFLMQVMHYDHHLCQEICISSRSGPINAHTTLMTMEGKKQEWTIKVRHQTLAVIAFQDEEIEEDDIPPTLPFHMWDNEEVSEPACLDLKVPCFEAIMESQTFVRFLTIMDEFYLNTTALTPSDAKQTVMVGIAESSFATRIPLKVGNQFEQVQNIAKRLHPGCKQIKIVVPPVPLRNPIRYPAYLVQAGLPKPEHVFVFIQKANTPNTTVVAQVPCRFRFDTKLLIQNATCLIRYHNAALVKRDTFVTNQTADVLTVIQIDKSPAVEIFCGGHPSVTNDLTLPVLADFASRCEFAMNTQGWIAADEVHYLMKLSQVKNPTGPEYHGIAVWDRTTNELLESGFGELQNIGFGRVNIPVFSVNHWMGIELEVAPQFARATLVGFTQGQTPQIADCLARFLDLQMRDVEVCQVQWTPIGHMCGWQILARWSHHLLPEPQNGSNRHMRILSKRLTQHQKEMIDEVIIASRETWDQATDFEELKESAAIFRQMFLVHRAKHDDQQATSWDITSETSAEPEISIIEDRAAPIHQLIESQLIFINNRPTWLCTDECDAILENVRRADPETYYPSPARWDPEIGEFQPWTGTLLSFDAFKQIIWLVIIDQHWVQFQIKREGSDFRVLVIGLQSQKMQSEAFASTIADMCHTTRDHIDFHFWISEPPDGLCGWVLLFNIFAAKHVDCPRPPCGTAQVFQISRHRNHLLGATKEAYETWKSLGASSAMLNFCSTARDSFLLRVIEGKVPRCIAHAGAPNESKSDEIKEVKAKQAVPDPLFVNDPWARKLPKAPSTRWEDLLIPKENPFVSSTGSTMCQTHRLQLATKHEGLTLATKQHLAEISKTPGKGDLAVILPSADKATFGEAETMLQGPYELVLEDPAQKTTYKRLVLLFVVRGTVSYKLKTAEVKCESADFVEIVAEIDNRVIASSEFQRAKAEPIPTIRKLMLAINPALSENLTMYGFRSYRPVPSDKTVEQLQVICRTQRANRATLLEGSGNHGLLLRDFFEKPVNSPDTTVLPKFWSVSANELHSMLISTQAIPGAAGAALTCRGIALRIWTAKIAEARTQLLHDDARLTSLNRHVIPVVQYESSGWPSSIEVGEVIKAVAAATGTPPVPTRAYRTAGVHYWSLAFGETPNKLRFTIDVSGSLHEVLLVPSTNRYNPRVTNKQPGNKQPKKAKQHQSQAETKGDQVQVITKTSEVDELRLAKLEAKVDELEGRQDRFEKKFDSRLDGVDAALRQLLQRSEPRTREATHDSPPAKMAKNS